jgi:hypothetical protein
MDLWIKTQKGGCIVKVNTISHSSDGGIYANDVPYGVRKLFGGVTRYFDQFILGEYATEARAIEVVQELWTVLRKQGLLDSVLSVFYEMPKE